MTYASDTTPITAPGGTVRPTARVPVGSVPGFSYIDWAAIIAGGFIATATSMLMLTFGSAVGLSLVSAERGEGASALWVSVAAGIWFIWVVLSSVGVGAYLAGRLRHPIGDAVDDEVELRDGAQGLVVWALAVVLGTMLGASGIAGATSAAVQGTAAVAGGVTELAQGPISQVTANLTRDPTGAAEPLPELAEEVTGIIMRALSEGEFTQADQDYLVGRIATETGQTPAEVETRVEEAQVQAQLFWNDTIQTIEDARRAAIITAFAIAATLLAAAAAAYFAAVAGGKHRDDNIPLRSLRRH